MVGDDVEVTFNGLSRHAEGFEVKGVRGMRICIKEENEGEREWGIRNGLRVNRGEYRDSGACVLWF